MADEGRTTTQRVLRVLAALAGAAAAGLLWLVLGSSPASAEGLGDPLAPVVDAVADTVEPVVAPVSDAVAPVVEPVVEPVDAVVDPVVEPVAGVIDEAAGALGVEVPPVPALPIVDPGAPLVPVVPVVPELPVVDGLPAPLPEPVAPTPTLEAPADGGAAAARAAIGPAVPAAGSLERIGLAEGGAVTELAPPSVHHRNEAGSTGRPAPASTPPAPASSSSTSSPGGSSRGDPAQLAVLLVVAALALGSGRRVSWPAVDWRPVGLSSLIERPG
jgi:hypothetical protein